MSPAPNDSVSDPAMPPSEDAFKKQAELARQALKNFNAIRSLDAPGPIRTALYELVPATVSSLFFTFPACETYVSLQIAFNNFVAFSSHPLFQEIIPAVYAAIQDFTAKHPNFDFPTLTYLIKGLDARARGSVNSKKGMSLSYFSFFVRSINSFIPLVTNTAAALRPEKGKKGKNPVCSFLFSSRSLLIALLTG